MGVGCDAPWSPELSEPGFNLDDEGVARLVSYAASQRGNIMAAPLPPRGLGALRPSRSHTAQSGSGKSLRQFVILALAGVAAAMVTFVLMFFAFNAWSVSDFFVIVGYVLLAVCLASIAATLVGIVGAVVRIVGRRRRD
ncbi:hypothetical protein NGTWS0302_24190 [Mycolicibacterium cyprinidarum]|uniref:Phage holin family protein n=1 Tax=Mycolicibacterium cyprinidarum TaxID=2860311 RepID=A0ABQ4VEU9_9MYCO|nr:hypothetical protein NGTWS0302_24190 [Mycolicibacterium sp. NGTWS0302]GJF17128.1 hypothetical protein NGTWS1702_23080 [Mycolicibacterium sp. NGTWSNA01]